MRILLKGAKVTSTRTFSGIISAGRISSNVSSEPADLKLSDAQKEIFDDWNRPFADVHRDELLMNPIKAIDLVQDITTDCSVVASLCAGTARESKGHETV